ncbi:MAG: hypothetical protein GY733_20990 [bacterium]|nr:hypothetical protein [bacterium]
MDQQQGQQELQQQQSARLLVFRALTIVGLGLMVASFFSPMWWVSLKAVNYPEETFPDGIRIHMHWTGVRNGCIAQARAEVSDDVGLDCVEEMDTINHYIGMEPIGRGAQREFAAAPYLFIAFGISLVAILFYSGPGWWLLAIPPILAPVVFVADFTFWLWWFGHNLKEWAAFTVKPFMPTVLGEGLVAQFSTFSYPHYGMLLSAVSAACIALAVLIRRKHLQEQGGA